LVNKFFTTIQGLVVLIRASAKRIHFFTIVQQDELRRLVIDQDVEEELEYEVDVENVNDDVESKPIENEPQRKWRRTSHTLNREKPEQMLKLKQIGETRWSCRVYALVAIMRTYKALKIALVLIGNDAIDAKHVAQVADLLGQINTFKFILMMHLMIEVLEQTHDLSQLLQRRGQDLGNVTAKVANTVSRLKAMRSDDENFMKIYDQAEKFARDNAVVVPDHSETMFQRTQDIRMWLPGTRHIDRSTTVIDWHRINFFYVVLDKVLNKLDYRFNASNLTVLKTIHCFMPSFFPQFDSALIKEFASLY
jgi:hypothetical protein